MAMEVGRGTGDLATVGSATLKLTLAATSEAGIGAAFLLLLQLQLSEKLGWYRRSWDNFGDRFPCSLISSGKEVVQSLLSKPTLVAGVLALIP